MVSILIISTLRSRTTYFKKWFWWHFNHIKASYDGFGIYSR